MRDFLTWVLPFASLVISLLAVFFLRRAHRRASQEHERKAGDRKR